MYTHSLLLKTKYLYIYFANYNDLAFDKQIKIFIFIDSYVPSGLLYFNLYKLSRRLLDGISRLSE